jgi:radical SAM protein with 4Fe4S-binding SPASM domain
MLEGQRLFGRDKMRFGNYYIVSEDKEGLAIWADQSKKGSNVGYPWGIYGYNIRPNGIMVPDPLISIELGDLRTQKLSDIWKSQIAIKNLRHRGRLKGKCGRCEFRFVCGGHRGRAYLATNDFMAEDPACWYEPRLT